MIIFGIGFLMVFGCTKEIDLAIPKAAQKTVVNAFFSPASEFQVSLSRSQDILALDKGESIPNAIVLLYQDNKILDTLDLVGEVYQSSIIPRPGENYGLQVLVPDSEPLTSNDYLPPEPRLLGSTLLESVTTDREGDVFSQASITFYDDPDESNFYELLMFLRYKDEQLMDFLEEIGEKDKIAVNYNGQTNDPVLLNEGQLDLSFRSLVFSDALFNGQTYTMKVQFSRSIKLPETYDLNSYDIIIFLRAVTPDYYTYQKTLAAHQSSQVSDLFEGAGIPVPMFTNITNGLGIFAGYNQVTDTIFRNN